MEREGLLRTPRRAAESFRFLTSGYSQSIEEVVGEGIFHLADSEANREAEDSLPQDRSIVTVGGIEYFSMCEHHILPFFGKVYIAYVPREGVVLGLSKFARLVEIFARRLQVQERLTHEIADAIESLISPLGLAVVVEGVHLCMAMRGVQQTSTRTKSTTFRGELATRKQEVYELFKG